MDHYSFQGPYAYRWVNDVPVERIHLANGERREIRLGERRTIVPAPVGAGTGDASGAAADAVAEIGALRALMAAWN
ncbi:MAG: hypothetical protein ACKO6F_11570 [Cyanobium sp.]